MRRCCLVCCIVAALVHTAPIPAEETDSPTGRQEGTAAVSGDSPLQGFFPHFRRRALIMNINARLVEQNQTVIWNESHQKTTMPGHPVGIKLVGANLVVVAQFTPYIRRGIQKFLVAQGQIWMEIPNQGIRYHTSMQTIPLEFGEPVYFFPLGPRKDEDAACIEVMLTLHPYEDN
ncbi:MAG: hypothetical protein LBH20_11480 [Treponema sp.]|jgi:hypothetical protein|nr:hypothetical protein [Treponema sp.]